MGAVARGKRNSRAFREEIFNYPRNAVLFSDQVLIEVLKNEDGRSTSEQMRVARAELAVRYFLSPRKFAKAAETSGFDVKQELENWIGPSIFKDFISSCTKCELYAKPKQQMEEAFRVLREGECKLSEKDARVLCLAFRPWLTADGVIPVFDSEGAYLLPFSFDEEEGKGDRPRVLDVGGQVLENWTAFVSRMNVGITRDIRVSIHRCANVTDSGNSLMLPLVMAWWRNYAKLNERLPRYSPIRFIATGAFEGDRVGAVQVEEKAAKINDAVEDGFLVRPGNRYDPGTIPEGVGLQEALAKIREIAELQYKAEPMNAVSRLEALERSVCAGRHEPWELLIKRIDRLWEVQNEYLDEEGYLLGLMLRSAARCHAGRTEEALSLNQKARSYVQKKPQFNSQFLRLRIEELVLLADREDLEKVFVLADTLEHDIAAFVQLENSSDRALDLQMRFHGTMGQSIAYAILAGVGGYSPEQAKKHFENALKSAQELARGKRQTDRLDELNIAIYNCGQDANYLLLWSALFDLPGVSQAAAKAKRFADRNREYGYVVDASKNDRYRYRFMALACYRALLRHEKYPLLEEQAEIAREKKNSKCDEWIRATIGKYLGAIAAVEGDELTARHNFEEAIELLRDKKDCILKIIQMTILSEAYRSLRRFPEQAAFAEEMRLQALAFFDEANSSTWHKSSWRDWLASKGADIDFPGLKYWY